MYRTAGAHAIAKRQFAAEMSHEIRTPLSAVIGYTDLLLETDLNGKQADYVRIIQQNGIALLRLVEDLLDTSKTDADQLDFQSVAFDPELLVYDVCDLIKPNLIGRPVALLCNIGDRVPGMVKGDPLRFRQVVANLLGNAQKFTEDGEIELCLNLVEETQRAVCLETSIRDTGIGISPDSVETIFEPFRQASQTAGRDDGGFGLGLSICKTIAKRMKGDVRVQSAPGRGSVFRFTAWLEKTKQEAQPISLPASLQGKRALLVEKNRTSASILGHLLTAEGMETEVLHRGASVRPRLEKAQALNRPFDLCIADIRMPDMDGVQLAAHIRSSDTPVSATPLIALSSALQRDAQRCRQSGFTGFLNKPVRRQRLLQVICRVLQQREPMNPSGPGEPEKLHTQYSVREDLKHSVRILLVEDHAVNRKLAECLLKKAGYRVTVAQNGLQALDLFTANPQHFDLILMDVQMPGMDGRETTRRLRAKGYDAVPIVAMTAGSRLDDRQACLAAGMNGYITKPIHREAVFAVIQDMVLQNWTA